MQFNIGEMVDTPHGRGIIVRYNGYWGEYRVKIGDLTYNYPPQDITPVSASSCTESPPTPVESTPPEFKVGDEVEIVGSCGRLGVISELTDVDGVPLYKVSRPSNTKDGSYVHTFHEIHELRKKPMKESLFEIPSERVVFIPNTCPPPTPQISIQDAYNRMKEELERNPLYYNAWLKKLGDEVERCIGADFANEDIAKILSSLFKLPPMSYNDFEKFH